MTAEQVSHHEEVGCVVSCETGVVVVLTDDGPLRATYGAKLLGRIARDRSCMPGPGDWVALRRWSDGPLTVEHCLARRDPQLAPVVPLRRRRST